MGEVLEIVYFPNHDWNRKKQKTRGIEGSAKNRKTKQNKSKKSNQFTVSQSRCYFASLHNSADSKQNHGKSLQS